MASTTISTLEVGDLFSVLGAHGIERQLRRVAGVDRVSVNPVSGLTTVAYDPGMTGLSVIQAAIEECGFHCAGEALPRHICDDHPMPSRASAGAPGGIKLADAKVDHKAHGEEKSDAMAQEMGHGAGMDMQTMVRDMRNRFLIALAFSLPIFAF
jgi:Cu2+-exporting ATPase